MLATSVRVRPCSALSRDSSEPRFTDTWPSSSATEIAGAITRVSSPFGPFTFTVCPSIVTVTPFGMAIGSLPIRDMVSSSPDQGHELAAGARLPRVTVGHEPLGGAEDGDPQPVADTWNLAHADVLPETGR